MDSWHMWQVWCESSITSPVPSCLTLCSCPFWALGKKPNTFRLSHFLRENYIGEAVIVFLENLSYLGVSRHHCHQFLASCRKEAFRAGNLLAPDPQSIKQCEDRTNLGDSTEEQRLLAVPAVNANRDVFLQHRIQRCSLKPHFCHRIGSREG